MADLGENGIDQAAAATDVELDRHELLARRLGDHWVALEGTGAALPGENRRLRSPRLQGTIVMGDVDSNSRAHVGARELNLVWPSVQQCPLKAERSRSQQRSSEASRTVAEYSRARGRSIRTGG